MSMNNFLMRDCPCKEDCPDREPGCNCEKRIEWKNKYEEKKKKIYRDRNASSMIDHVIIAGKTRRKK